MSENALKCSHCRIGRYQNHKAPYLEWVQGEMMLIPDVPVHVCDICGHMKYDPLFLENWEHMKTQISLPPLADASQPVLSMARPSADWQETRRRRE